MAGEVELLARGEHPDVPCRGVIDVHRLGEPEIGRKRLAIPLGDLATVEENTERVPAGPVLGAEHPKDVQVRHSRTSAGSGGGP